VQGVLVYRFARVVVHPRGEAVVYVFLEDVRGHRDYRHVFRPIRFQRPYRPRGFVAVHYGHLDVHQDKAVFLRVFPEHLQRLFAVFREVERYARVLEVHRYEFAVHLHVFG